MVIDVELTLKGHIKGSLNVPLDEIGKGDELANKRCACSCCLRFGEQKRGSSTNFKSQWI